VAWQSWPYEGCAFATGVWTTAKLSTLLASPGLAELKLDSLTTSFDLLDGNFSWQRIPSVTAHKDLSLPWPSTEHRLSLT
jgi:hypothetical protein